MSLDRASKLALGYMFIYCIKTTSGNIFLGIVDEIHWHLIKCFSAEDFEYRKNALLESEFYEEGESRHEHGQLLHKAEQREGKQASDKHIGIIGKPASKILSLTQWDAEGMNDINERGEVKTKAAMGNA